MDHSCISHFAISPRTLSYPPARLQMAKPPQKKAFLELLLTAHIQSQSLTLSKTRIKPLICCKSVKIWLHFKSDPKLKSSPNVLLLGKWSISFAHNNFCLLQFSLFPNPTLRDAIRGGKIKQLKESHEIPRRPLIPISFKRVLAPNLQNIWFSGVDLCWFFFSFGEWSWSSDPHLHIKNDEDALEKITSGNRAPVFCFVYPIGATWIYSPEPEDQV